MHLYLHRLILLNFNFLNKLWLIKHNQSQRNLNILHLKSFKKFKLSNNKNLIEC
jgi:hypothetical protein